MKRAGKPMFFIVFIFILIFTEMAVFGVNTQYGDIKSVFVKGAADIRWGIDIRGGVDVTFSPQETYTDAEGNLKTAAEATAENMAAAEAVIKTRLVTLNITDSEVYTDTNQNRIIVRFPWKSEDETFDPDEAIKELGETALLTFYEGMSQEDGKLVLSGVDIETATRIYQQNPTTGSYEPVVQLKLFPDGAAKFSEVTGRLYQDNLGIANDSDKKVISIWMDETLISYPSVNAHITDGTAVISGGFDDAGAKDLADKINSGALPFKLVTSSSNIISPKLGLSARDAMMIAGIIAYVLIVIFLIAFYKLPGVVAGIGLLGQIAGMLAGISGFLPMFPSFTLTIPGIAGIILSVGMGVDANIIIATRIKEELHKGKSIDNAISVGYSRGFTAVFDGNATMILVAIILMGAFGAPGSFFSTIFSWAFFMFGATAEGSIYSFGYTLLIGVVMNFIMGITATKLMSKSLARYKMFRKPALYGGAKNA